MVFAFCWAGRNREVLSSVLQSMHPKKSRDPASQVPSLWNCIWAERCSICEDMNELIVLLYKVASMCVSWRVLIAVPSCCGNTMKGPFLLVPFRLYHIWFLGSQRLHIYESCDYPTHQWYSQMFVNY